MSDALFQLLSHIKDFAAGHLTLAGIVYVTIVFFAGYSAFTESRPSGQTWYWWAYGLLGFVGYVGFALHSGRPWPVLGTFTYIALVGLASRRYLRARGTEGRRTGGPR